MPYSVVNNHPDCDGWSVVKDSTNELLGCHKTKAQAEDQLTAINISEFGNQKAERFTPIRAMVEKNTKKTNLEIAYDLLKGLQKTI